MQVERAHRDYPARRLVRSWTHLERQRGGTGSTGTGVTVGGGSGIGAGTSAAPQSLAIGNTSNTGVMGAPGTPAAKRTNKMLQERAADRAILGR